MSRAQSLFVGGTASHVGKSWMATAICSYLKNRGFRVAPFKAQNMSNNSCPCPSGGEIGRAQAAQAEACGIDPHPDMNPILLKPETDRSSQVVVNGRTWKSLPACEYYTHHAWLLEQALAAYERLALRFDFIVLEGAGSMAELNLRHHDLVNFGIVEHVGSPVLLVADIDRGGVFASVIGTVGLLEEWERHAIRSFAVNRFRGDPALFENGVRILEERSAKPCLGVFPMLHDVGVDAEDAVSLENENRSGPAGIAVLRLPRIANLTDVALLHVDWIGGPVAHQYNVVIIPGTKSTLADLAWMRQRGLDEWVLTQHAGGARIIGICGGYQILGEWITDPSGIDAFQGEARGLGLLPVTAVMEPEKIVRSVRARSASGTEFDAYEIHLGRTSTPLERTPVAWVNGEPEGIRVGNVIGTYLHGALEDAAVASEWLGLPVQARKPKQQSYDELASWFAGHSNIPLFEELYL